jgi:hypothetical protein
MGVERPEILDQHMIVCTEKTRVGQLRRLIAEASEVVGDSGYFLAGDTDHRF